MRELDCLELYRDAAFYDEEFAEREFEIPFCQRLAKRCGGPILEVACGTGRLTIPKRLQHRTQPVSNPDPAHDPLPGAGLRGNAVQADLCG